MITKNDYVIGTTNLLGTDLSIQPQPTVHTTLEGAQKEATRLISTHRIPDDRKCVIFQVVSSVRRATSPVVIE